MHTINKLTIFIIIALTFFACQQKIDDYFMKETEESVNTDILSFLKENEEYSKFVALIEKYGLDSLINQGMIYTFFVPNNNALENIEDGILDDQKLVEYLTTESLVNLNQIKNQSKIQTLSSKFAVIERTKNASYTFDGVEIIKGSPLTNNGRYYEIAEVVQPKPSLYEYISATNEFYRNYLDSRDSIYLDTELSTPIGYTPEGRTIYDTVFTTVNLFEETYFEVSSEFRDDKATMLLFTQEQYDEALQIISNEIGISISQIPVIWQNEVLMPYLIERSVFRNALSYSAFAMGRAKNILGDSVDVFPENISSEYFECSNGRAYNLIDFKVPDLLYKINDTIPSASLLYDDGGVYKWLDEIVLGGQLFNPFSSANSKSVFGRTLLIDMGKNFNGDFSFAYTHKNVFPGTYKLTVRANISKLGIYNIFVNGKQFPVDINDGKGPQFDFDFFNLRKGVISSVTGNYYPFADNFCSFDILIDNISDFGDVEVKLVYVSPSERDKVNCGINLDFISLDYFNDNN